MLAFRSTLACALLLGLFTVNAKASSWTDDDSWKTASPYYYGDQGPSTKDQYKTGTLERRIRHKPKTLSPFTPDSNNVSLDIGQNFLVGSDYQDAIGLQGSYTYGVSNLLAFTSALGYSGHSEGKYSKLHLLMGPRLNLASYDRVIPYINGGLGFYHATREMSPLNSISGTMFGVHLGAGADLQLTRETYFGAALTYHQLFGTNKETTLGPIDLASNYITFMAHVGYTF
ncbi:MAG: outer membrane beta-barrel protein [Cryobacterium sp.]|nr:outer membrane beta-barrel protein [Oligoflexia bacterium]